MEQKMHKRILSFIEEERLLSGDERICVDIFRRLKKNRSYLPSLHAVVELAKSFNCSADFLLGLSDFPDSADENIDVNSSCKNLNRFAKLHPTKFYLLKKQGFCKEFSSFYNWLNGKYLPDALSLAKLAKRLNISADALLKK